MVAAQAGDSRAYDRLLRDCLPLLRAIARRRIADRHEAEDAVLGTERSKSWARRAPTSVEALTGVVNAVSSNSIAAAAPLEADVATLGLPPVSR